MYVLSGNQFHLNINYDDKVYQHMYVQMWNHENRYTVLSQLHH